MLGGIAAVAVMVGDVINVPGDVFLDEYDHLGIGKVPSDGRRYPPTLRQEALFWTGRGFYQMPAKRRRRMRRYHKRMYGSGVL